MDMMINGKHVTAKETFEVFNPATLELVGTAPRSGPEELEQAVRAAKAAQKMWCRQNVLTRRQALRKAAGLIQENRQEIAHLLTLEQGKPISEAVTEVYIASAMLGSFASIEFESQILKQDDKSRVTLLRKPLGVVATITPWNFPLGILCWKLGPAVLAGNAVISKPASFTPLSTLKLIELINQAFPPGVVNSLSGPGSIGAEMVKHPEIRKVSFTGSVEIGKGVMRDASEHLKRLTLELGGNDPAIILDDADVDKIANSIYTNAFQNAGQICINIKRVYAHERVYSRLVSQLTEIAKACKVGPGVEPDTQMGPLNNKSQLVFVEELIEDARERGGRILAGGERLPGTKGYFLKPTIVTDLDDSARLVAEEQFGPALPILPFRDIDDAVQRANDSLFGLGASVWGGDVTRACAVAAEVNAGTTWVNQHYKLEPDVPFGGQRQSGLGRELGIWGIEEFCELQIVNAKTG
ncbi:MAG: aldehyde dehydrogenase family protein [Deltaproteobacteria bacterium]|nr:aldehyde dehydrogenase family protein [Deltaproteobacteria bacterium]